MLGVLKSKRVLAEEHRLDRRITVFGRLIQVDVQNLSELFGLSQHGFEVGRVLRDLEARQVRRNLT